MLPPITPLGDQQEKSDPPSNLLFYLLNLTTIINTAVQFSVYEGLYLACSDDFMKIWFDNENFVYSTGGYCLNFHIIVPIP